jgi:hypothetical protein
VPGLDVVGVALAILPWIWLAVVLRLGPLSPQRKSRAAFWKGTRTFLVGAAAYVLFVLILITGVAVYWAWSVAPVMGQSAPSLLRGGLWGRGGEAGLILYLGPGAGAALAALYVAHRLGPLVRRLEGQCVRCGYLLHGLTEPRCPECGTPFNPADLEGVSVPPAEVADHQEE